MICSKKHKIIYYAYDLQTNVKFIKCKHNLLCNQVIEIKKFN